VIPSRPSHALAPLVAVIFTAWVGQGYHLTRCPKYRGHFCPAWVVLSSHRNQAYSIWRDRGV